MDNKNVDAIKALTHAMSPSTSGVYDELQALLQTSIVRVNPSGIPVLVDDWYTRVDLLFLDDMDMHWSVEADPSGKYGVAELLRDTLSQEWCKSNSGWALADDPEDIIFDFGEFDEWRDAFEDEEQLRADSTEGVGRFGI
jgi:hypothetical protein